MQRLLTASVLALATLLAGCGGSDDDTIAETVKLKVNQPKTADSARLTLTMTKFIDSRCPSGVQCVTAGSAVIEMTLAEQGKAPAQLQMTLGPTSNIPTYTYGSYRIEFIDMQPLPTGPVLTITDSEATLVVRRP